MDTEFSTLPQSIGLIVNATDNRVGRELIDQVLAFLVIDIPVCIFVASDALALLQLKHVLSSPDAGLARESEWRKTWGAVIELGGRIIIEAEQSSIQLDDRLQVECCSLKEITAMKRACLHLVVI